MECKFTIILSINIKQLICKLSKSQWFRNTVCVYYNFKVGLCNFKAVFLYIAILRTTKRETMQKGTHYYAVIFTSLRTEGDKGYNDMSKQMVDLAKNQPGFIGVESAREAVGITVSYWETMEDIQQWRLHTEHKLARKQGKEIWYSSFKVRICQVLREYEFSAQKKDAL